MKKIVLTLFFLILSSLIIASENKILTFDEGDFAPLFPFVMEKGSPQNITNVQTWDKPWDRAGTGGMIKVVGSDFTDQKGKRFFFGTNLCGSACFPTHEDAVKLADTLARCGVNIVRLHHMDNQAIWGKNFPKTKLIIDPNQLDRLDYLIAQLQKRGIYVNINLHVSRRLDEKDGFPKDSDEISFNKGLDNFEPRMIEYQKKYAKDLLTHRNPYTNTVYTEDPGIAMIEINNENSVVASWAWGSLDSLSDSYKDTLRGQWNNWLQKKYKSTTDLRSAWKEINEPFGPEQIKPDLFANLNSFQKYWQTLGSEGKEFTLRFEKSPEKQKGFVNIKINKQGESPWIPQFNLAGFQCKKDKLYTFVFKGRSKDNGKVGAGFRQNHDPWSTIGFHESFQFTPEWKEYIISFKASSDDDQARLTFDGWEIGKSFELADFSLREGGHLGLPKEAKLEAGTIPLIKRLGSTLFLQNEFIRADWTNFLKDLEAKYWQEMYHYVKNVLKARPPVSGTQLQYGFWYEQGKLDYCDIHAYWNHPRFPGRSWDHNNWTINNRSLANHIADKGATLPLLASVRVIGSPLTVSEYDHPYPNLYNAEGNPMIAAFGAFQNWGAIYQFAWSHNTDFDRKAATQFFDVCGNQAKLVHFHANYALFTRGDVRRGPGQYQYSVPLREKQEIDLMSNSLTGYHRNFVDLGLDPTLSIAVSSGLDLVDLSIRTESQAVKKIASWKDLPKRFGSPEKKWIKNEFGELLWNFEKQNKGYFCVDTTGSKIFSGFIGDRSFSYQGLTLIPGKTRLDWATITLVKTVVNEKPNTNHLEPGRYLLTASGLIMNTDAKLAQLPKKNEVSMSRDQGGSMGHAPVLCEGIPLELILHGIAPEKIIAWSLNQKGDRNQPIKPIASSTGTKLRFGPNHKTLWYEIEIKE